MANCQVEIRIKKTTVKLMRRRKDRALMVPLHLVVPHIMREAIENAADSEGISIGAAARDLLGAGIKARGIEC